MTKNTYSYLFKNLMNHKWVSKVTWRNQKVTWGNITVQWSIKEEQCKMIEDMEKDNLTENNSITFEQYTMFMMWLKWMCIVRIKHVIFLVVYCSYNWKWWENTSDFMMQIWLLQIGTVCLSVTSDDCKNISITFKWCIWFRNFYCEVEAFIFFYDLFNFVT